MISIRTSSIYLSVAFLCTLITLATTQAPWPPPGQACPCICTLTQDPHLVYILGGAGIYKQVDCTGLRLREIPSDFPLDTQVVLLGKNNIRSVVTDNLDELTGLLYLDLTNNVIASLPRDMFRYNTRLQFLNIGWNSLKTVAPTAFVPFKKLTRLMLPSNSLAIIPSAIQNLPALHLLDLSNNKISTVDRTAFRNLPVLQFLNLESNQISAIDANVLRQLSQLMNVLLTNNVISYLPTYVFHGLQNLDHVALGKNLLVNLPGIIFRGAPRLRKIDLHQNKLTYLDPQLFRGMRVLEEIHLQNNRLQNIPPGIFQGLRALGVLNLSGNTQIRTLPVGLFRGLNALEELYVSHLQQIPQGLFWGLRILEGLTITDSSIDPVLAVIFRDLNRLQTLNLSSNGITMIPDNLFQRMTILEELDLSSNQLTTFSMFWFNNQLMRTMMALNLQNNNIELLPAEAFVKMPALADLNLEGNKLSEIQDGLFAPRTLLESLLLSNNELQFVSEGIIPKLTNVERLTVTNNRLTCDCHMRAFAEWLKMHVDAVVSPNEIVCAVPRMYRNRQVVQLIQSPQNPFTCIFPQIVTRPRSKQVTLASGASKEMFCQLSDSAVADIYWNLPDGTTSKAPVQDMQPVSSRPRVYSKASGSMVINSITTRDAGIYVCQTSNSIGTDQISYDIRVIPPLIPVAPTTWKPVAPTTWKPVAPTRWKPVAPTRWKPVAPTRWKPVAPTTKKVVTAPPNPTGVPNHGPVKTTALPGSVTINITTAPPNNTVNNTVTPAPDRGLPGIPGVTAKIGTSVNRTTLMTFTRAITTLPLSLCNPNPCKHGGQCLIVLKTSNSESVDDESQESYSSSAFVKPGSKFIYDTPTADRYMPECTCRKKWGGPVCQYKKPDMPKKVTVIEADSSLITLTWSQIHNIQGYRILYSKVGDRTIVKSMPIHPQVSSYTMEKLAMDATYRVCVVAFNQGGDSPIGEQNCIWAETSSQASGLASLFNIQLIAIGGGCVILLVLLVFTLYCYQKHKKGDEIVALDSDTLAQHTPRPHSSASEMIRRSMRRPTNSFYSNTDDVMLIDLAHHHSQRPGYMNPFDGERGQSGLLSDLEGSTNGSMAFADSNVYPRANARKTLKIQDDTKL